MEAEVSSTPHVPFSAPLPHIAIKIAKQSVIALLDCGSQACLISIGLVKDLQLSAQVETTNHTIYQCGWSEISNSRDAFFERPNLNEPISSHLFGDASRGASLYRWV